MKTTPPVDAVDEVEVVVLDALRPDSVTGYLEAAAKADAPRAKVLGQAAQHIATLWNELRPGEQDRCHIPPFGLRFFSGGRLLLEASLCWECNNIFGKVGTRDFSFEFDASAPSSKALLARAREAVTDAHRL